MPRSSVHQAVITVTNALLLKLDFKVGICKSTYTLLILIFAAWWINVFIHSSIVLLALLSVNNGQVKNTVMFYGFLDFQETRYSFQQFFKLELIWLEVSRRPGCGHTAHSWVTDFLKPLWSQYSECPKGNIKGFWLQGFLTVFLLFLFTKTVPWFAELAQRFGTSPFHACVFYWF